MWREARPSSPEAASNAKPRRRDALVPAIRVLLANDRQIILWGLERLIDAQAPRMKVVAKAISNAELLSQTVRHHPDVTLLDLDLDGENTVDLIPSLLRDANARVLILSGQLVGSGTGHVGAVEGHGSRGRPEQARGDPEQCRLAGAVGAEEGDDGTAGHGERGASQDGGFGVAGDDVVELEHQATTSSTASEPR